MDYSTAVNQAPPGWAHFTTRDLGRLPEAVRSHELARVPREEFGRHERGDAGASERVLKALFWTLVYHLEPERWDELAQHEPIAAQLLEALPQDVDFAVDVGAGGGRLTRHLCDRARTVVAVEPSIPLGAILRRRVPSAGVVAGWAEALPLESRCSQLTAACGAFGPDPRILAELQRVTAPGGSIVLINPEQPDWFAARGWRRMIFPPTTPPPHARRIDEFFGPLDPPHEMVMIRVGG